ncbi:MAG TPA: isochorismatase family protein [Dehalococcoidia bacterium]|nr:isochorismatase family protein [Dehalococcoidia bacterium]
MPRTVTLGLIAALILATLTFSGRTAVRAQTPTGVQLPTVPDPVAVTLDSAITAFLALDFMTSNCAEASRPTCVASLPAVNSAIAAARAANVPILFTYTTGGTLRSEVVPDPADVNMLTSGADKFFNTTLDDTLKQLGASTLVLVGTGSNGAILYTAFGAAVRGYTVVVAEDGISASTDFATYASEWQLLNEPGAANAQNAPLQPKAATLSRTDLITYK